MNKLILFTFLLFLAWGCHRKETEVINPEPSPESSPKPSLIVSMDSVYTATSAQIQAASILIGGQQLNDRFKYGITAYKMNYRTTYKGSPIIASGLVYIPLNLNAPAPIISIQHGTTFQKNDAPTVSKGFTGVEFFASAGYITIMPDFIGYGASASINHPYYDANHSALAVTDMLKATKEYLDKQKVVPYNPKVFLTGYSEGGYVTLAAQRSLTNNPISGLNLTGVAAGAGGYDMIQMLQGIATSDYYTYPSYLAFITKSYNEVYDWKKPTTYFYNQPFADRIDNLLNGENSGDFINTKLTTNMDSLFAPEFYYGLKSSGSQEFKAALVQNSLTDFKSSVPLRLYHGTEDEVINYDNSVSTYNKLKSKGAASIELIPIQGANHNSGLKPMIISVIPWLETIK